MQGGWQPPGGGPPGGYGAPPPGQQPVATAPTMIAPSGGAPAAPTQPSYGVQPLQPGYGAPSPYALQPAGAFAPPGWGGFGQYEFNELENGIIGKTAGRAKTWGIISIVIGALYLLSALFFILSPALLLNIAPGIGGIIVGISFVGVGNSLSSVVATQGNDVQHMMEATQKLGGAFLTQIIVTIVQVVLYAILALVVFVVLAAVIASGGGP